MKLITIALFTVAGAGAFASTSAGRTAASDAATNAITMAAGAEIGATEWERHESRVPAAAWAPRDTADTLWRRGRIAISEEEWGEAAMTFERLATRYPNSTYAGDALYWQAFALQRLGGSSELRRGVRALEQQKEKYAKSATYVSGESTALLTRLNGRLARGGDAEAAAAISELAMVAAQAGVEAAAAVMPMVVAELDRARPEIERSLAEAARDMNRSGRDLERMGRTGRGSDEIPSECEGVIGEERIEALNALLQMSEDQALPILKKVLARRDKCSEVLRRKAVFLVSQKRSEEAVDILLNTAKTDPDRPTREDAVFWLSQTRSERAVEVLEQILLRETGDEELQKKAIFALSQTRSDRAGVILRDYIRRKEVSEETRAEAISGLGQRRNYPENATFLREIFPTLDSDELREKVFSTIARPKSVEASQWLLAQAKDKRLNGELRKSALFWAGQSGAAVKDFVEIYDTAEHDRELRNQVIFVLSQRRGDSAAIDKLVDIARREKDSELRQQAIFWLGQSRDPRAVKLLEEIINRPF